MASTGASIPLDIATRQMTIANFDFRPANGTEILGIATATCLLGLVLCCMFWTGLRMLWDACPPKSDVSDIPPIMKTPEKGGEEQQPTRQWPLISRGTQTEYDGQEESPCTARVRRFQKPHAATQQQQYYTQFSARRKRGSRKPLLLPNAAINTTRQKDTTLDMEEGLGSGSNAADYFVNGGDCSAHPSGTASCRVSKSEKSLEDFDMSFLHCRTASL
ncbi:hypothetical protein F5Y14DRAFT_408617 [Nemania sp. NC0429]|nr:hypothetical protein F5Y14DRAFT_408617 [Nemania sp. NC0429]